jgi:hypothetical protein
LNRLGNDVANLSGPRRHGFGSDCQTLEPVVPVDSAGRHDGQVNALNLST